MMIINSLKISGFKSIDEIELKDIPSFMVLAGANGSGKSNFVDALAFLGEVIRTNLNHAVEKFHGIDFICNKLNSKNDILLLEISGELEKNKFFYLVECYIKEQKSFILYEQLRLSNDSHEPKTMIKKCIDDNTLSSIEEMKQKISTIEKNILIKRSELYEYKHDKIKKLQLNLELSKLENNLLKQRYELKEKQISTRENIHNDVSFLRDIPEAEQLIDFLSNIEVFRIDPIQAKMPSLQGSTSKLLPNGSNIADILEKHQNNPEFRDELMEWLEMIVPNLSYVQSEKRQIDTSSVLRFQEGEHTFPAGLISDGTIYTLCILTAILSRSPQYGITIIEEPERGIHPQAIGELIALMREKAKDKHNIILTTHSEAVVRNLELDELYLVRKKDGKTLIKDIKNSKVDKNKIPLDTAWLSNLLGGGLPW